MLITSYFFIRVLFIWLAAFMRIQDIHSWYMSLSVSMAYFNKTFTKNYSGLSQEMDFEAARKEGRR